MEFRILGPFEIVGPAGPVDLRGAKRRGLLAYLLVHVGRPMSTDRLVEELWGDGGSDGAARTVQTYVSQLRKLLRPEAVHLVTRPGGYVLEVDPAAVDAFRFEQGLSAAGVERDPTHRLTVLDGALALWRGPPLDEFAGAGWADREATRLDAVRVQGLRRRCETLLELGRAGEAVVELETLVRVHPLDEGLWVYLMLALYRSGRQADALAAYQRARRHLVAELGVEPGPELVTLEHRILAQDPALVVPADSPTHVVSGTETATFLFCDLVGSTALLTRLGDDAGDEVRRQCYAVFREALAAHGGSEVKSTGDGIFAVFPTSVEQAVACGTAMQRGIVRLDVAHPLLKLGLRVGIAMGEAKAEEGDWYGTPVVEAERLCAAARRGQILVADVVCTLAGTRGGHSFRSVGALDLKGLARPLAASEVKWSQDERARPAAPAQPAMAHPPVQPAAIDVPLPAVVTAVRQGALVGRDVEQERLAGVWAEAKTGRRQMVLMAGEPGIGKSRLAAELAAMAHNEGAVVLWGRCDEGLAVAYQPVVEALRHYVRHCGDETLDAQLGGARWQLARLVPELAEGRLDRAVPSADAEAERLRMFDAVSVLLGSVARSRPLLLVQDDLHWAATPTLLLLRQLARPADDRVLIVGTYRDTELDGGHPIEEILVDLRREPTVVRLAINGLDEKAVASLVEAEAGHVLADAALDLAPLLYAETDGNPFFLGQVLGHLIESGALDQHGRRRPGAFPVNRPSVPEGLREVIERRVARQRKAVRRILTVAAVIGRDFSLPLLERIPETRATGNTLLRGLEKAARARLIRELPGDLGHFAFVHDVVRQTLYEGLSGPRRARLHLLVAEALEELARVEDQRAALAGLIAETLEELPDAGVQPTVIVQTLDRLPGFHLVAPSGRGSRDSRSLLARRIAERLEDLVGSEAQTAGLTRQIAEKLELVGPAAGAAALGDNFVGTLAGLPGRETPPTVLAHHYVAGVAAGCRSEAIAWSERAGARALEQLAFEEAVTHFQNAIELLEWDDPADRAARARLLLAEQNARGAIGDVFGAKDAATRAVDDARALGSADLLVEAAISLVWWIPTDPDTAQLLEDALAVVDEHDLSRHAVLLGALAFHRVSTGWDWRAAEVLAGEAVTLARRGDDPDALADILAWRAQARVLQGSPDVTAQQADLAELATLPQGTWHQHHGRYGWLDRIAAVGRLQVGDLAGFDAYLERLTRFGEKSQSRFLLATAAQWRGLRALIDGRFGDVKDHAADMLRWAGDDAGFANNHTTLLLSLRRDQGRLEKFKPLLLAATAQAPGLRHMVRLALAFVHIELGELDEARARLAESVDADIGPRGLGWSVMLAARAEVCAGLGDTGAVDELTTALSPYTGQLIVVGTGSGCLGAADRYRGMVAATGGQLADAERLFETALALEESIGSAPLASRTRVAHARALLRSGHADLVRQAMQLLDAAADTAQRLGMAGLMHEIDSLRGTGPHSD